MQMGRVIGDVVASQKDPNFDSMKLMLVQPIGADGKDVGRPLVAVDAVGAGVGETIFFVRGKEASFPWHPTEVPADAGIVGIIDSYHVPGTDQTQ
ncbi:MAG TPA: EutN/CcmL family microcompartment protein [Vicinamibacterales bacterium]